MRELLVVFDEPIMNPHGDMFFAEALGRQRTDDALWEGWLEFIPVDDPTQRLSSCRETTQPKRTDLEYWSQGLSRVYLQGALLRAQAAAEEASVDSAEPDELGI
jgi:hypothetical protein